MFISEKQVIRLEIEFSKPENQIIGAIELGKLPENFILQHCFAQRLGALTSSGAPTITVGNAASATGYVAADVVAQTDHDVVAGKGSLLYDAVDKHFIAYPVLLANEGVNVVVATAAITAGKVAVYLEGFCASQH